MPFLWYYNCNGFCVEVRDTTSINEISSSGELPNVYLSTYRISRSIRHTFYSEKCDLNSNCVLCAEGKYFFQTYKYPYPYRVKTTMKMILVAVTTIFWVSMMNKLYYGC